MALKFLNKKGWHTGSLRNVENVWKAEQKHEAEQKKLEELRKQIHEERERSEFRLLQEQAGLVPRQERLDFLYDSGLSVGKGSSDAGGAGGGGGGFKALEEALPLSKEKSAGDPSSSTPGALFEDKPHSANDAWRKLHTDPLLLIRQREQEALARIRNNPVQMALIRKSTEGKKQKEKKSRDKETERPKKHQHDDSKQRKRERSGSEDDITKADRKNTNHKGLEYEARPGSKHRHDSEDEITRSDRKNIDHKGLDYESRPGSKHRHDRRSRPDSEDHITRADRKNTNHKGLDYESRSGSKHRHDRRSRPDSEDDITRADRKNTDHKGLDYESRPDSKHRHDRRSRPDSGDELSNRDSGRRIRREKEYQNGSDRRDDHKSKQRRHSPRGGDKSKGRAHSPEGRVSSAVDGSKGEDKRVSEPSTMGNLHQSSQHKRRGVAPKLSEEERAAKLRQMQEDANLHEEQRWKRLKRADENDASEAAQSNNAGGKNFLDAAHRSIYGAEKGGSATIEESVRRRSHYSQGRFEGNAFRR